MTIVSSLIDSATSLAQPAIQDHFNKEAEKRQEQYNIRAEEREQGYIISSENRANAEYDRRLADQRLYDSPEAVASRYAMAGINPVSAFSGGVVGQTSGISPSGGKAPSAKPVTAQNLQYQPTNLLDNMEKVSAIQNTNAQTKLIEEQTHNEYEKGLQTAIANAWSRYELGHGTGLNSTTEEVNYDLRYDVHVKEDGTLAITNESGLFDFGGKYRGHKSWSVPVEKTIVDMGEHYGTLEIYDSSLKVFDYRANIEHKIGLNKQIEEDLNQSLVDLFLRALNVASTGRQSDASMMTAMANSLEARYKFGDLWNTKRILEEVWKGIGAVDDLSSAFKNVVDGIMNLIPGKSMIQEVLSDGDGVVQSIKDVVKTTN